jgi:DNA-binding CsgD family transcriptional regulator
MARARSYRLNGRDVTLRDLAEITGQPLERLRARAKAGWSVERIVQAARGERPIAPDDERLACELAQLGGDEPLQYVEALVWVLARRGWAPERISAALRAAAQNERETRGISQTHTLQEIGDRWGMTREGIRKLEELAIRKLRNNARARAAWDEGEDQ